MSTQLAMDFDTLARAREDLRGKLEDGATCPCCGQFAKKYRRKLSSTMAAGLVWLVQASKNLPHGWVDVSTTGPRWLLRVGGTLATLRHWTLIEPKTVADRRVAGTWRPTPGGVLFAQGADLAPRYVVLYNNEVQGVSPERIHIRDALGSAFDYDELMEGRA